MWLSLLMYMQPGRQILSEFTAKIWQTTSAAKERKVTTSRPLMPIENFLLETCTDNDLILTMGAGDIYQVGEHLLGRR